jgi:CDP-diglyceride synthetase
MTATDITIIASVLVITLAALRLTHRFVPHHLREPHNDVAGFIFAAVSMVFAVPLAFVVVALWTNTDAARQTTFKEADEVAGIYWIARDLPLPLGAQLEHQSLDYAHTVIDTEWPLLSRHQTSPAATALVYDMRNSVFSFTPANAQQQVMFDHAVSHIEALASERRARLNQAAEKLPSLLWMILIGSAVITILFTFLFGLSSSFAHTVMVLTLAGLVAVALVVVKEMSYPYAGSTKIDPTAFEVFLSRLPTPR